MIGISVLSNWSGSLDQVNCLWWFITPRSVNIYLKFFNLKFIFLLIYNNRIIQVISHNALQTRRINNIIEVRLLIVLNQVWFFIFYSQTKNFSFHEIVMYLVEPILMLGILELSIMDQVQLSIMNYYVYLHHCSKRMSHKWN